MSLSAINMAVYVIHIASVVGIFLLLLVSWKQSPRKLSPGFLHLNATALLAGVLMVGLRYSLNASDAVQWPLFNNTKIAIKLGIVLVVLIIGYKNVKKPELSKKTWLTLLGLVTANLLIASLWR